VKTDGTLWAWGDNALGELGTGSAGVGIAQAIPVQVGSDAHWARPAAGVGFSACAKTDGTLWTWGDDTYGELGNGSGGTGQTQPSPVQVAGASWTAVAAGGVHAAGIQSDASLWSWGYNYYGQLGIGIGVYWSMPTRVP